MHRYDEEETEKGQRASRGERREERGGGGGRRQGGEDGGYTLHFLLHLQTILDYVHGREDLNHSLFVFGRSLGGAVSIPLVAANEEKVKVFSCSVFCICPFSYLLSSLARSLSLSSP